MTYGTLPERDWFLAHVTDPNGVDLIDPDRKGPLFPEDGYRFSFGADVGFFERFKRSVNEGIDAHLEAVMFTQGEDHRGSFFRITDPGSMHTLLRRMSAHADTLPCTREQDDDCDGDCTYEQATREVSDILYTLGVEQC